MLPKKKDPQITPTNSEALSKDIARGINESLVTEFGMMSILPNPDRVLRKAGVLDTALDEMESDPHIKSMLRIRQSGVLSYEWDIAPGNAKPEHVGIITKYLHSTNHYTLIRDVLKCVRYGYQPIELIYDNYGDVWLPECVAKPRYWFSFDMFGNLHYTENSDLKKRLVRRYDRKPAEPDEMQYKFLCPRYEASYDNPYGESVLSLCYWNMLFKKTGKKFWAQFTELFGFPLAVAEYMEEIGGDENKVNEFLSNLINMAKNRVIALPKGSSPNFINGNVTGASDLYQAFINDARLEITWAILGHNALNQSTSGKLGNEDTALEVASWVIKDDVAIVTETINELIQFIANVNGWVYDELPRFYMYEKEDVQSELIALDKTLFDMGVRFTKDGLAERYELNPEHFDLLSTVSVHAATFEAQNDVDAMLEQLTAKDGDALNGVVKQVQDYIANASTFEELKKNVSGLLSDIDTSALEEVLYRSIAATRLHGRYTAQQEV